MKKILKWIKKNFIPLIIIILFLAFPVGKTIINSYSGHVKTKVIPYTTFTQMVKDKKVSKVTIDLSVSTFEFTDKGDVKYSTDNPKDKDFKKNLLESGIKVEEYLSTNVMDLVSRLINFAFIAIFCIYLIKLLKKSGIGKTISEPVLKIPKVTFNQVAGNTEVKEEVQILIDILKSPLKYTNSGAKLPKGILLYGPPGTGKTLIAKAIAGEAGVPFFSMSGSDFDNMYVGVGSDRVRDLFKRAREKAPCIIFIDEFDAVGSKRTANNQPGSNQILNTLLTQMDGFLGNEGVLVIGATNLLENLDSAVMRRFDKQVVVPLPQTHADRLAILNLYVKNKKISDDLSLDDIAKQTIGFSGSDLEVLINEATINSVTMNKPFVDKECIDKAFFQKVLKGHQKIDPERQLEEIKLVAWHEGGHALVAKLITTHDVPKVTIIQSTSGAGGVTFFTPKKMGLLSKEEICNNIKLSYGGRVAEFLLLGSKDKITTGASSDIKSATEDIKRIIMDYGMNDKIGLLSLRSLEVDNKFILEEATKLSNQLYEETVTLLTANIDTLEKIANALIEKETLNEDELDEIINNATTKEIIINNPMKNLHKNLRDMENSLKDANVSYKQVLVENKTTEKKNTEVQKASIANEIKEL